jgi:hypothetical protein
MSSGFPAGMFEKFLKYLFESSSISVPQDYHDRCDKIHEMLDNDVSGTINTILDYAINSASESKYRVECSEETLQKLLNLWLNEINIDIKGIPTGLQALSKEYFTERWSNSSFCILRVKDWQQITIDNVTISVPKTLWFVNGSSIYVVRPKDKNYKLGSDKFYLDAEHKIAIPADKDEEIIIQKPYNRWFDQYATPYLIRRGVYKNWLGIKTLQEKSDEVISKILPYLFLISKGDKDLFLQGDANYTDEDLAELADNFKTQVEKYTHSNNKIPVNAIPFDTTYSHLIPDLSKILKEELYRQGYRSILAGLGFVDMLEIAPSRQETRMNPKAFIAEINDGVSGFKSMLLEIIYLIEARNKKAHPKLFSDKGELLIVNNPLKINVEQILDSLRSGYDRGVLSYESYIDVLGLDYNTEKERRIKEAKSGEEEIFYPRIITNQEDKGIDIVTKKPKNEKNEDQNKNGPEKNNFKNAEIINEPTNPNLEAVKKEELEIAPYTMDNHPSYLNKYPKDAIEVWVKVFNETLEKTGDESKAYPYAWTSLKRFLKKNYIKQPDGTYKKKE